jgi:hypothetical protein
MFTAVNISSPARAPRNSLLLAGMRKLPERGVRTLEFISGTEYRRS